jgi:hypothetical protein
MADDAGRIYVFRFKSILKKDAAIRAGFLYEVREDPETGEYLVIRQKIMNWESMKAR